MPTLANNLIHHAVNITASNEAQGAASRVVDRVSGFWGTSAGAMPAWWQVELDRPITMTAYAIQPISQGWSAPRDWTLSGSTDGTTWTQLDSQVDQSYATWTTWNTYTFANTTAYRYYRFNFTRSGVSGTNTDIYIGEMEMGGTVANDITGRRVETLVSNTLSTSAAANMFDHSAGAGWTSGSAPLWVQVKFDQALALTDYTIWPSHVTNPNPPVTWTVSGSDDAVTWTVIHDPAGQTWRYFFGSIGKGNNYKLANRQGFLYYRFDFSWPTSQMVIQELELIGEPGQPGFNNLPTIQTRVVIPYLNDKFEDAFPVVIDQPGIPYVSQSRSNEGYTKETGEPGSGNRSMWWVYKPLASGSATFDTQLTSGTYRDTQLDIYTGSALNALTRVTGDDESGGGGTSKVTYTVTAGTTYYIRVATWTSSTTTNHSNYVLRVAGPVSKMAQRIDAPPLEIEVSSAGTLPPKVYADAPVMQLKVLVEDGPRVYDDAPPAELEVSSGAGVPPKNLNDIPPAELEVSSGAGVPPKNLNDIPPAELEVSSAGTVPSKNLNEIPPAELEVSTSGAVSITLQSPPVYLAAYLGTPTVTRVFRALLDPPDNATVPAVRPVFSVTIRVTEGTVSTLRLDVQYDDNADFSTPVTLSRDVNVVVGENIVRVTALADVPPLAPQFWRARLTFSGQTFDWTPARQFTVDPAAGDYRTSITWSVTDGPTDPHLWFITPAAGKPGELVTVIGQGFSLEEGTVTLAGTPMPIQSWEHVPASPAAATVERVITGAVVDPEHDEVVVAVPDVSPPGGQLAVSGS